MAENHWGVDVKKLLFAGVALGALAFAAPASAQPMPVYNWTGYYIGAHCGFALGRTNTTSVDDDVLIAVNVQPNGGLCGGQLGANWQTGAWVFGFEADLGRLWLNGDGTGPSDSPSELAFRSLTYG